eukprot:CAMPEP_0198198332 /NCGR_PEP_ID=MMETSP1445-20131203/1818_1 /TAXON_ID=36898 /ORGANISM="Pyramimonas sp., Strain CCMP2087" /LENGTH=100 /DNA_ID=CAMNT_0043867869 /DNA_START=195 /DNA_END=497 /DNA_ORIENTATION=+
MSTDESTEPRRDPRADESISMHAKPGSLGRTALIVAVVSLIGLSLRRGATRFNFRRGFYARPDKHTQPKRDSADKTQRIDKNSMSPREIRARAAEARLNL